MGIEHKSLLIEAFRNGDKPLRESSLSQIIKHITEPTSTFAQISASRKQYSKKENEERHQQLKQDVRKLGFGFIEMAGGFEEEDGTVQEKSLFIPNMPKDIAVRLGEKYEQFSVIWKSPDEFIEIGTNKNSGINNVISRFKKTGRDVIDLNKDSVKNFWSQIYKGAHRNKKFLFVMERVDVPWWAEWRIHSKQAGDDTELWFRIL
jgi:hypothetical protein